MQDEISNLVDDDGFTRVTNIDLLIMQLNELKLGIRSLRQEVEGILYRNHYHDQEISADVIGSVLTDVKKLETLSK